MIQKEESQLKKKRFVVSRQTTFRSCLMNLGEEGKEKPLHIQGAGEVALSSIAPLEPSPWSHFSPRIAPP